jgi:nucleotide-binding universal stress UspA family protein
MKKILIAVDGSAASLDAARQGLALARAFNGSATLAFIIAPTVYGDGMTGFSVEGDAAESASGETLLSEMVVALRPLLPVPSTLLLRGQVAQTLAGVAADSRFDVLVVGNSGRGAVSRAVLGSVADRLVHLCKTPLLLVR